jgi:hypothetical protein
MFWIRNRTGIPVTEYPVFLGKEWKLTVAGYRDEKEC